MDRFTVMGAGVVVGVAGWPWWGWSVGAALGLGLAALGLRMLLVGGDLRGSVLEALAGAGLGMMAVATLPEGPRLRGQVAVVGLVVTAPVGRVVQLGLGRVHERGGAVRQASGRIELVVPKGVRLAPGDAVVAFGLAGPLEAVGPPGAPDAVRNGARARLRTRLVASTARRVGPEADPPRPMHGLLRALATGDRSDVAPETTALLRRTGTSHLLAISGFHVGLVAAGLAALGRWPARALALWRPEGVRDTVSAGLAIVAAAGFSWSVGAPVSAQRATGAVVLVAMGLVLGRRVEPSSIVALVATLVLVVDPTAVGGPSFQLSFGAVLGLLTWGRTLASWVPPDLPAVGRWASGGLVATVAATVGTLPAAAWWFQSLAPWSPLANLFAVPLTGFVLVPGALGAVWLPEPLAGWAAAVGQVGVELLLWGLSWCDADPWQPAVGPLGAAALCGLFGLARRPVLAGLLVGALLARGPGRPAELTVTFPDVGQGSAALLAWPDGVTWLVDGGAPWGGTAAWLRRRRVRHLDVVVVSHGDLDHVGGLVEVLETVSVGELRVGDREGLDALLAVAASRGVTVVDEAVHRLHPVEVDVDASRNDRSSVVLVDGVLLPGDVGRDVERALAPGLPPVTLLALAHHGSATSTSDALLGAAAPSLAVVQAARGNRYGHPHADVLRRLASWRVPLLRTDLHGTVEVRLGETPTVRVHRAGVGWRLIRPAAPTTVRGVPAMARARPPRPP